MKDINQITFCALMSALNVSLMFLGSIFCYAPLLVAVCCGYINSIIANEIKFPRAMCAYFVIFFIANLFVARKSILIDYVLFSGFYPIIEPKISKIGNLIFKLLLKFSIFFCCAFSMVNFNLFLTGLIGIPIQQVKIVSYCLVVAWCFCFDYFLQDIKKIYILKIRPKLIQYIK